MRRYIDRMAAWVRPSMVDAAAGAQVRAATPALGWQPSLALMAAALAYAVTLQAMWHGGFLLADGDTYWHIAAGQWMLERLEVPLADPFSYSMPGTPWVAHEWLSEVLMALAYEAGGWLGVVALTALAFALGLALFTRSLAPLLPPVRVLLLAAVAVMMTKGHLLARPHILALPVMMLWVIHVVRAADEERAPAWWLLPVMTLWANLHGGFTLGLAMAGVLGAQVVWAAHRRGAVRPALWAWGLFLAGAALAAMVTPNGWRGPYHTWHVVMKLDFAISRIGEWASPNFHEMQPLAFWLAGVMALAFHRGLRLPPLRSLLVLGLLLMALRHMRYVELLGLLAPLVAARALAAQWPAVADGDPVEGWLRRLPLAANLPAQLLAACLLAAVTVALHAWRPAAPPAHQQPVAAVDAARSAGLAGHVFHEYGFGGYLILRGIPAFIDGRADMYGDAFLKAFVEAKDKPHSGNFEKLADRHGIGWTLLAPDTPLVEFLDRQPGWKRVHTDKLAVIHARTAPLPPPHTGASR